MGVWKAGLAGIFASVLLIFQFLPTAQASPDDYSVSIDPQNPLVHAGDTCSIEITVKNESNSTDSYTLEVNDDAGWNLELQENRWEDVGPGQSRTTILSVTVPGDTEIGFEDSITISVLNSADIEENVMGKIGVLRGDVTDWGYVATGAGVVIAGIAIVLVLWKGGI